LPNNNSGAQFNGRIRFLTKRIEAAGWRETPSVGETAAFSYRVDGRLHGNWE